MKNNRFASIFLVMVFLFALNNYQAQAGWPDKSEDLPGMSSSEDMKPSLIVAAVGAVVVTGLVVFLVIKNKKKKQLEPTSLIPKTTETLGFADVKKPTSFYNELSKAAEQSPVQFIAGCNNFENQKFCNKQVMSVGVRIRF